MQSHPHFTPPQRKSISPLTDRERQLSLVSWGRDVDGWVARHVERAPVPASGSYEHMRLKAAAEMLDAFRGVIEDRLAEVK
jgi:hypothetical protein